MISPTTGHPPAHILCVDDDPELLETLEVLLGRLFPAYKVTPAESGADALAQLGRLEAKGAPLALVLSDQILGDTLGTKLLATIGPRHPNTPRVIFTGYADIGSAVQGLRVGIDDFLEKPIREAELRRALTPLFERYELSQAQTGLTQRHRERSLRTSRLLELAFRDVDEPLQALLSGREDLALLESDLRRAQGNLALLWRIFEAQRPDRGQHKEHVSARELVEEAAQALTREGEQGLALEEAPSLEIVERSQRAVCFGVRSLSRLALERILHNAWRFNPPGEPIAVIIRGPGYAIPSEEDISPYPPEVAQALRSGRVAVSISNAGILSAEDHRRILQALDRSGTGPLQGIGLVMAQELLAAQGGDLYVDATPGEDGTTFHLTLPSAAAAG